MSTNQPKMKRRNFLKGAFGVTIGLPFLESLYVREAEAQTADNRFGVFIRQPSGVIGERYWPAKEGAITKDLILGTSLSPLESIASQLLVVRGIMFHDSKGNQGNGCHHATGMAQLFTGTGGLRIGTGQNNIQAKGESLDNRIAREYKQPALALYAHGTHDDRCMTSFAEGGKLQSANYSKPYAAYQAMFSMQAAPAGEGARKLLQKSALDYVHEELKELMASPLIGTEDKTRLQAHFALVRETEVKMSTLSAERLKNLQDKGSSPNAKDNDRSMIEIIKLHMDVIVLAISAGGRRSANLQIGDIINQITYSNGMVSQHENTHHCDTAELVNKQVDYDKLHNELFRYLVEGFNKIKIGNKTLMDHGFVIMGSEVGDGRAHSLRDIPTVIAGSVNGALKQGQYISVGDTRNSKLLNTLGAAMGLKNKAGSGPMDDFGDTSGGEEFKGNIPKILA